MNEKPFRPPLYEPGKVSFYVREIDGENILFSPQENGTQLRYFSEVVVKELEKKAFYRGLHEARKIADRNLGGGTGSNISDEIRSAMYKNDNKENWETK